MTNQTMAEARPAEDHRKTNDKPNHTTARALSPAVVLLFAVACGLSVANIYFAQPLLDTMAQDLSITPAVIGGVVTLTQVGYAFGLMLIVPLGDLWDRRRLIVGQTVLSAIALTIVGSAPNAAVLLAGMVLVGLLAVVIQVLVAYVATLAAPADRGRTIGTVTSGVVSGILLARFAAGVLADLGGWRVVYLTSAALTLVLAALLARALPRHAPQPMAGSSYAKLLRSTLALFVEEQVLRERAVFALLIFASFSVFWSSVVLPLAAPPLSLSHTTIGMLGIAGLAGALAARNSGQLADRGWGQRTTGLSLLLMLAGWVPIACLNTSLWLVVAGILMIDFAVQAIHVTNQSLIVAARPDAASRLVGGYMVFYSIGTGFGAISSTMAYAGAGWPGVCVLGAAISACALLYWVIVVSRTPAAVGAAYDCGHS
ncbi:putative MFS family arabinose efflux permease [Bradyrhizobium sp. USDA 4524]|uniref:MFS transporter n=1 Tax=unclassified Bradyrhizobium TaxID=2631580 RepID=UPI00209FCBC3|nr:MULTISPECIES: MFS transporter [unclassified Bradyrhizobium]MCP1845193.1 putative MFS family arabinose efflux permease [Bradyrhizobium sp. USDA 4538]MCP1905758.1 putative MFS family arabinose efflux permease [Bradyrhizobium sp. USDA 4537]MCP1988586.1 putative MFS family arabinose efflux permease [Bradyrhizobium sp. USDA 4539]